MQLYFLIKDLDMMTETALIVVDLVNDFTRPDGAIYYPSTGQMMDTVCSFIDRARQKGAKIIYIQNVVDPAMVRTTRVSKKISCLKGSGGELLDERLDVRAEDIVIQKNRFSAFFRTNLEQVLQDNRIGKVIILGTKTNCCVRATAIDSQMRDYDTYIVKDCVSTNTQELNQFHLEDLAKYTATVLSSDEIIQLMNDGQW